MKKLSIQKKEALKAEYRSANIATFKAIAQVIVDEGRSPANHRVLMRALVKSGAIAKRLLAAKITPGG